jgi:hypothetical protein
MAVKHHYARSLLSAQLPDFWKMHGIGARRTWYRQVRVCFPRDSGKGIGFLFIFTDDAEEFQMHIGSVILVIWLVIGGFAAGQRGDYKGSVNCSRAATAAITILAGPLNYTGVDPHINCTVQHPSS